MENKRLFQSVLVIFCVLLLQFDLSQCGKYSGRGGGSRGSSSRGSSRSRPSPSRPGYGWSQPAHPAPSPGYGWSVPSRPAVPARPAYPAPAPAPGNYGWNYKPSQPSIPGTQTVAKQNVPNVQGSPGSLRPTPPPSGGQAGWTPSINKHVVPTQRPGAGGITQRTVGGVTQRPVGGVTQRTVGGVTQRTVGGVTQRVGGVSQGPGGYGTGGQGYNKQNVGQQQSGYPMGPAVNKPYPTQGYKPGYQQSNHPGTYAYNPAGGNTHVTIINQNKYKYKSYSGYNPPGYYAPPIYYPSYHYSSYDTGSTTLGFFLGYSLAKLTTPSYYHYGSQSSYRPQYDHYQVHHYYHNSENVQKTPVVQPNAVVVCVGDTATICPPNNYALCTTSGSVMCVASAAATVPCTDIGAQATCVQSTVPCINNTTPDCRGKSENETTTINIPCVYNTKVMGNITYVNRTIVVEQPPELANSTNSENGTMVDKPLNSTMISDNTTFNANSTTLSVQPLRRRREVTQEQQFCVTVVADPAPRQTLTENEVLFNDTSKVFSKFMVKAFGLA